MEKQLKDYLKLYLGCDVYVFPPETFSNGWLKERVEKMPDLKWSYTLTIDNLQRTINDGYFPILRPLSDINNSEHINSSVAYTTAAGEVDSDKSEWVKEWHGEAARSNYIRSVKIDIDALIESGLAIDATKQTI